MQEWSDKQLSASRSSAIEANPAACEVFGPFKPPGTNQPLAPETVAYAMI